MQVRKTKPGKGNLWYISQQDGGYNPAIRIAQPGQPLTCLPNCVGYAIGRFHETANNKKCNLLPKTNANTWMARTSLKSGMIPKIAAVACWDDGEFGHVAIVEQIIDENTITISDSVYGGPAFRFRKVTRKENWGEPARYKFQGFIYNPYWTKNQIITLTRYIANNEKGKDYDFNGSGKTNSEDIITLYRSLY